MSWYGNYNESAKQLDSLLDTRPSLASLLLYPDFIQQLKSFNPKLLDYITNSLSLPSQLVTYLSVPPLESDPVDRKYKLPLLAVEMVETETICVLNALMKGNGDGNYFLGLWEGLRKGEVLPLLAGYFNRVNFTLCRTRYKEVLESVYSSPQYLQLLIAHSDIEQLATILPLYLCIETSKGIPLSQPTTSLKLNTVRSILQKLESERIVSDQRSTALVQNLCLVLRQIVQKYYLIAHGKQMLEIILEEKYVGVVMDLIGEEDGGNCFPAMSLMLSFLKYYSLSAFNSEEGSQELARKNMERLEAQPFVRLMNGAFKPLLQKVKRQKSLNLYGYSLLEVLCHCITLSSTKILTTIKQSQFLQTLIDLTFKNQNCNILHKLVQRAFLHIFTTEKNIYERYKEYLFCEISIIDLTAKRVLEAFPEGDALERVRAKGYFGNLMKIIKIYSSISTTNLQIREAITAKSQIWNKITKKIIKPYEASFKQQMGQFENVPETAPIEFTVKKTQNQLMPRLIQNAQAVEQIKREQQTMPKTLQLSDVKKEGQTFSESKIDDQSFFKSPVDDSLAKKKGNQEPTENSFVLAAKTSDQSNDGSKRPSFNDFLLKKKMEVGEEIKMQRSQSGEKRLSADKKTRLTSPSPSRKRNSWKQQTDQDQKQPKPTPPPARDHIPKLPIPIPITSSQKASTPTVTFTHSNSQNSMSRSTVQPGKNPIVEDDKRMMSLSMANLESLKKTTIIRTTEQPAPTERKYRKAKSKDKALFAYLGINC